MADFRPLEIVAIVLLGLIVLWSLKKLFNVLYLLVLGPVINKVNFKSMGQWAIITGATDGIGKQYAKELASRGCDIVLISRTLQKLRDTAQELERDYKVSTKVIQADFAAGDHIYEEIENEIKDMDIGTVINNVGLYYQYPEYFLDIPNFDRLFHDILNVNVVSAVKMTQMFLPRMLKKGKGVIVNVASSAAVLPTPLLTVYSAAKAFVDKFTVGIQQEYSNSGVIIQSLLTGGVATKLSGLEENFITPTPEKYVKSAITTKGTQKRTTGFVPHSLLNAISDCIYSINEGLAVGVGKKMLEKSRASEMKKLGLV